MSNRIKYFIRCRTQCVINTKQSISRHRKGTGRFNIFTHTANPAKLLIKQRTRVGVKDPDEKFRSSISKPGIKRLIEKSSNALAISDIIVMIVRDEEIEALTFENVCELVINICPIRFGISTERIPGSAERRPCCYAFCSRRSPLMVPLYVLSPVLSGRCQLFLCLRPSTGMLACTLYFSNRVIHSSSTKMP